MEMRLGRQGQDVTRSEGEEKCSNANAVYSLVPRPAVLGLQFPAPQELSNPDLCHLPPLERPRSDASTVVNQNISHDQHVT
jgi:hypothetical protein